MKLDKLLDQIEILQDNSVNEGNSQMNDPIANEILEFAAARLDAYIEDMTAVPDRSNAVRFGGPAPVSSGVMAVQRNFHSYSGGALTPTVIPVILKIGTAHKNALELSRELSAKLVHDIHLNFDVNHINQNGRDKFETNHSVVTVVYNYASAFASVQVYVHPLPKKG